MEKLPLDPPNNWDEAVQRTVDAVERGAVVAVPTDTVYGVISDAADEDAVGRLFAVKQRSADKPLGVFVRNIAMAERYTELTGEQKEMLHAYWPGRVTFIVPAASDAPFAPGIGTADTVGVRMPDFPFLQDVLDVYGKPLAQSSANLSGGEPMRRGDEIDALFAEETPSPALLVDAGELPETSPSSVVDITELPPTILRQ